MIYPFVGGPMDGKLVELNAERLPTYRAILVDTDPLPNGNFASVLYIRRSFVIGGVIDFIYALDGMTDEQINLAVRK